MLSKSLATKWVFWIVIGLSVVVIGLIIGGLQCGWSPEDNNFMTYCKTNAQDAVVYETTGDPDWPTTGCKDAQVVALNVERRPWKIMAVGNTSEADFSGAVERAANDFNRRVGCPLFQLPSGVFDPDIVVTKGAVLVGSKGHPGGDTMHRVVGGIWKVDIVIYNLVMIDELHRGLMHELGHAMGLGHDSFKDSLMFKGTSGTDYLTDGDKAALKKKYCGAK